MEAKNKLETNNEYTPKPNANSKFNESDKSNNSVSMQEQRLMLKTQSLLQSRLSPK